MDFLDPKYPATVSEFSLDKYEVTVGRFRAFVEVGMGTQASAPGEGAGAHPRIPGSGWSSRWSAKLPASTDALKAWQGNGLSGARGFHARTEDAGAALVFKITVFASVEDCLISDLERATEAAHDVALGVFEAAISPAFRDFISANAKEVSENAG